ncbi:MAG TPA: glycosyltransferase [Thermoleophilaceae bacterium]|jgi:glycosyltransferase involved in cell wall biosynthesis
MTPAVSVVVPTHNRPDGLATVLAALGRQTLPHDRFEVIVADDGSDPPARPAAEDVALRVVRHERPRGPAAARNSGWRAASAPLVAFVDDDCEPTDGWLAALVEAATDAGEAVVIQGPVQPPPNQLAELTPLSHTIVVDGPDRLFATCNIAYSRPLLERLGGFDETFRRSAEDVDMGARARAAGARALWAAGALVHHEVRRLGLRDLIRHTTKWTDSVRAVGAHPELRELLVARVFWKPTHPRLLLALAGLATRRPLLAALAALPYLDHYRRLYAHDPSAGARALPTHLAVDLTEIGTAVAGSIEHRTLML